MVKKIFRRPFVIALALILQLSWLFVNIQYLSEIFMPVSFLVHLVSVAAVIYILNRTENPAFKLPWILLILTVPVLGGITYFLTENSISRKKAKRYEQCEEKMMEVLQEDMGTRSIIQHQSGKTDFPYRDAYYLEHKGYPALAAGNVIFYGTGDEALPDLMKSLQDAEKYIFMEYFVITPGEIWLQILDILKKQAKEGVEIRFIYDDIATMGNLPGKFPEILENNGIRCLAFNPFIPVCTASMNHRDHRKILVVDGQTAFTGGFNLADEYFNRIHPYGNAWKDAGVRIIGPAAAEFSLFFLSMWDFGKSENTDYNAYIPEFPEHGPMSGYIQPYLHAPVTGKRILGDIYRNIINHAEKYIYIYTPYFIPDPELLSDLLLAADRGIDVRIIVPGVPDKKIIYQVTKSYFKQLKEHGIKIYTYTPGFLHAKCLIADDRTASVGTGNMDYRSLYHSFEDGCVFYGTDVVKQLKEDFIRTFPSCREAETASQTYGFLPGIYYALLKVFSPLL